MLPGRLSPPALTAVWPARHEPSFQHIPTLILGAQEPPMAPASSRQSRGRTRWPELPSWPGSHGRVPLRAQLDPTRGPAEARGTGTCSDGDGREPGPAHRRGSPRLPEKRSRQFTARLFIFIL